MNCAVRFCPFKSKDFFPAPSDTETREMWKKILNLNYDRFQICVNHIEDKYLDKTPKLHAIPTIFLNDRSSFDFEECQCCLNPIKGAVRFKTEAKFKENFKDLFDCELQDGSICLKCVDQIQAFHTFKTRIQHLQQLRDEMKMVTPRPRLQTSQSTHTKNIITIQPKSMGTFKLNTAKVLTKPIVIPKKTISINDESKFEGIKIKEESVEGKIFELSSIVEVKEEMIEDPVVDFKNQSITEQIVTNADSSFIIKEIKAPTRIRISAIGSLTDNQKSLRPARNPLNPYQKTKLIANNRGAIKISQHQLNLMKSQPKGQPQCPYCPNYFVDDLFVQEHVRQKHTFVCSTCKTIFPFKINLIQHHISAHGGPVGSVTGSFPHYQFNCEVCGLRFITKETREKHMIEKHKGKKVPKIVVPKVKKEPRPPVTQLIEDVDGIPCLDCGLIFTPDKLLTHRNELHNTELTQINLESIYTCDICNYKVRGKLTLLQHMTMIHISYKKFKCEHCEARFDTKSQRVGHTNIHHNCNGTRFICHFCEKIFASKSEMISHRKQHYGFKSYRKNTKEFQAYEPKGASYEGLRKRKKIN